jgi:hypothetical protein
VKGLAGRLSQIKPFGSTSNPDRRISDATKNRVADSLQNCRFNPGQ